METIHEACCGLDIHKSSIAACLNTAGVQTIKTYGTMTNDLLEMTDWLIKANCKHVAMESTGVYWKPIYNILEASGMEVLVVNAQHIKAVPGRKTDVKDAEWIADLLRHGLLRGSFIPDRPQRELRELVRYRRSLIEEQVREINRIQKILEGANIKLSSVVSDVLGKSGRAMLEAIIDGNANPVEMADLAKGRLKSKKHLLEKALDGLVGHHQRMVLAVQLRHIDFLESEIKGLSTEIEGRMRPFEEAIELVDEIPAIAKRSAEEILCEIGVEMSRFPTERHIASWAKLCPGNNESAGKRKKCKTGKGNNHLKAALCRAVKCLAKMKGNYFSTMYRRLAGRLGANKATVAVAHAILVTIYYMLKDRAHYQDLGVGHYDETHRQDLIKRSLKRLESLGYKVTIELNTPAA